MQNQNQNLNNICKDQDCQKIKICVAGESETGKCGIDALTQAKELGREIVRQGGAMVSGTKPGFPLWSAMGAKEVGGISVGFSPAATEREHVETYKLPVDYMDLIVFTGFGYPGRDLILVHSSDAVLVGCGGINTLHEFTVAFEEDRPIGILQGDWEMPDELKDIIEKGHRPNAKIVFDADPKELVRKVIALVEKDKAIK